MSEYSLRAHQAKRTPGMWLISRAAPGADISTLPMVVRHSLSDKQSQVRYYYIPLTKKEVDKPQASHREYWTCCWDVHVDVDLEFYNFQHSECKKFSFVRVYGVERPPLDSVKDALCEEMLEINLSLVKKALQLHKWSVMDRQLKHTMKRRANRIQEYLESVISRADDFKGTEQQTDCTVLRSHIFSRGQKRLAFGKDRVYDKIPRTDAKPEVKPKPRQPTYPPRESDYDHAVASGYINIFEATEFIVNHMITGDDMLFQSNFPLQ